MLARGRNADGNKNWGRKVTCAYRNCLTNTKDSDQKMFPFPKPCSAYVNSLIDPVRFSHSVVDCERCDKSFRWIRLCGNDGIANLEDVTARTYVCVKHFHYAQGPTEDWPDPLPARYYPADSKPGKARRAPSPLVEALAFVEAVYDADAVSQRIQRAISHAANTTNSSRHFLDNSGSQTDDAEIRPRKRSRRAKRAPPSDLAQITLVPADPTALGASRLDSQQTFRLETETRASNPTRLDRDAADPNRVTSKSLETKPPGARDRDGEHRNDPTLSNDGANGQDKCDDGQTWNIDNQDEPLQSHALDYTFSHCQSSEGPVSSHESPSCHPTSTKNTLKNSLKTPKLEFYPTDLLSTRNPRKNPQKLPKLFSPAPETLSPAPLLASHARNLLAQLKAERSESARLSRKLSRCQATSKRRLETIRQLKAKLKVALGKTGGKGGAI